MDGSARHLISVRTDVVFSAMVESLVEDACSRSQGALADDAEHALRLAPRALEPHGLQELPGSAVDVLTALARLGWHTREAELERFGPARDQPAAVVQASLTSGDLETAAGACVALARAEPLARPDPEDPDAVSWQIPGPGGHVRHYVALRSIGSLDGTRVAERAAGVSDPAELKRVWLFGFLLAEAARLR